MNKVYSDSTLRKQTKEKLIEFIRVLEHNWAVSEESVERQYQLLKKITEKYNVNIQEITNEPHKF